MKQTKLSDIIEKNVDDKLYLKKKDFEKRKYLKISLYINCTINGDIVTIEKDDIKPPQILKIKRTEEEKRRFTEVAKKLNAMGIYMAGLDVINSQIIEVNVTSPCYFIKEINNHFLTHNETKICDYIVSKVEEHSKEKTFK